MIDFSKIYKKNRSWTSVPSSGLYLHHISPQVPLNSDTNYYFNC